MQEIELNAKMDLRPTGLDRDPEVVISRKSQENRSEMDFKRSNPCHRRESSIDSQKSKQGYDIMIQLNQKNPNPD